MAMMHSSVPAAPQKHEGANTERTIVYFALPALIAAGLILDGERRLAHG